MYYLGRKEYLTFSDAGIRSHRGCLHVTAVINVSVDIVVDTVGAAFDVSREKHFRPERFTAAVALLQLPVFEPFAGTSGRCRQAVVVDLGFGLDVEEVFGQRVVHDLGGEEDSAMTVQVLQIWKMFNDNF